MAERKVTIILTPASTGLTLNAQLVDDAGADSGGVISTGFVELGGGAYFLTHDFTAGFVGGIKVFEEGSPGTVLTGAGIDLLDIDRQRSDHIISGAISESFNGIVSGQAVAGTLTNTEMTTNLTNFISGAYLRRYVIWLTGTLTNQASPVTDYDGAIFKLTYEAVVGVPAIGDRFVIV